ncbi:hypothetical protein MNBD_GAMMA04-2362, partial [hydrothermal vent metagenome]
MIFTLYHSQGAWRKPTALILVFILIASMLSLTANTSQLLLLGILLGFTFIHFGFGFTGYWRQFMEEKKAIGMRGHLWLLALGSLLFFPALTLLPEYDIAVHGAIRPLGANVLFGAFIFGVGMALAGTCSSGTLRLLGEFKVRFYWVFICMIIGGTFAASQFEFWLTFSQWGVFSFATEWPWFIGLLVNLSLIAFLYLILSNIEKRHHGQISPLINKDDKSFILGVSPIIWAVSLLALLNLGVLILAGSPWAVSWIFPKLGVVAIDLFQLEIDWDFWEFTAINETGMTKPLSEDTIFLTSLGFFLGVAIYHIVSHLTHSPTKNRKTNLTPFKFKTLISTTVAGLLMGYGAVIAYGCNIGGFFSAIISGSLHGWA